MTDQRVLVALFGFEELNSLALFNAQINLARGLKTFSRFVVYVPPGFAALAFEADEVVEYPQHLLSYNRYSEVNDFVPTRQGEHVLASRLTQRVMRAMAKLILHTAAQLHLRNQATIQALRLSATPRMRKYLFSSGLFQWAKADVTQRFGKNARVTVISDYIVLDNDAVVLMQPNLKSSFERRFAAMGGALSRGMRLPGRSDSKSRVVIFRTRNYSRKAPVHNTRVGDIYRLVQVALGRGWRVINIGSPCTPLPVRHPHYSEISNLLSIDQEDELLALHPVVQRADAGLFTWVCCRPVPICALGREWSVDQFGPEFGLMAARAAGARQEARASDLVLEGPLDQEDFGERAAISFGEWLDQLDRIDV